MIDYSGNVVSYSHKCPGCAYAKGEFELPCGRAYDGENFYLSQDWELPIQGFFVIAPKRHVEHFSELTDSERTQMFDIANKTINILKSHGVCDGYNLIFEEKAGRHFHVWLMPRLEWMKQFGGITRNIGKIMEHATTNMRDEENIKRIDEINNFVKYELEKLMKN